MKLRELGEFGLIEQIRRQSPTAPGVVRGIGDDAAELCLPAGHHLLTSTDLLIEDVHFCRSWTDAESLGHKAVAVNLSDLAAMGATPRYLYLGLACPGDTELAEISAFLKGALDEAGRHQVALVGGDTCRSPGPWLISVTVEGSAPAGRAVGRDGARPGDLVMVSGTLGDSALALQLLREGKTPEAALLERHHRPRAQVELGRLLGERQLVNAMIDLSDGLSGDLEHILQASRVDACIDEPQLPLSAPFRQAVAAQPALRELALCGGEDYQLLFTVPRDKVTAVTALGAELSVPIAVIGQVSAGAGSLSLRDGAGRVRPLRVSGYDHFCPSRG